MAPLGPFGAAPRIAAGVSGGPHSLALALLADRWARARGGTLLALVVDHGLRPESAAEAQGVAALLAGRGIGARVLRLGLAPGGTRLQERARAARMAALLGACREAGAPWLLLGHHRGDQAETLLFRALRGSGTAGLAGMAPVRAAAEALVLRPLLGVAPARLEAVVAAAGLAPVRDPSNADGRFARVRLRAALGDPGGTGAATAALAAAAAAFAARRAAAEAAMADRLAAAAAVRPEGFAWLDPAALGRDAVAEAALGELVRLIGGAAFAPGREAVRRLAARLGEGAARGGATLAGVRLQVMPEAGQGSARRVLLVREAAAARRAAAVPAVPGAVWDGRFRVGRSGGAPPPGDGAPSAPARPGWHIAALGGAEDGAVPAGLRRTLRRAATRRGVPGLALAGLPAVRDERGRLVAVPALGYPEAGGAAGLVLDFAPAGGPLAAWAPPPGGGAERPADGVAPAGAQGL
ncbi:tRNA lysidine(34) synthetase TilS [Caldovatus sp. SYSU G05006]|uniref:tRNA(Ile)-lysidine synthase n=2 Tax=Caldovatus aquaticus TaxID=2865671 RepID=A0ABS7F6I4_9PROT|nr:tRNA lysidine(34) synthetase TilS [Caldovatus aquaticus]